MLTDEADAVFGQTVFKPKQYGSARTACRPICRGTSCTTARI